MATGLEQTPDSQPAAIESADPAPEAKLPIYQWVYVEPAGRTADWPKSLLPEYRPRATSTEGA
jgi:hypothetical protein